MTSDENTIEMRAFPRYAIGVAVELHHPTGSTRGETHNVSRGGLAATLADPVPVGDDVTLELALVFDEDTFSEPLTFSARVVWCTPLGGGYQHGIAFQRLDADQQSYLDMFLRYLEEDTDG